MRIKIATAFVDDQDKALRFYTGKLVHLVQPLARPLVQPEPAAVQGT